MTAKRHLLLLPVLAVALLLAFALRPAIASASTTFATTSGMKVTTDFGKGAEYMARVAKEPCGADIQVRTFISGSWSGWHGISCTRAIGDSLATPIVTVDRTNNRVYVAWMQTSIFNSKQKSSVVYRWSSNRGRTWQATRRLVWVPTNKVTAGIGISASEGVLWLGWQSLDEIGDTVPALNFAPFNAVNGKQLHDSLLTVPSNRNGRQSLRVEAGGGNATMFWNIGSGATAWKAATIRPAKGVSGAEHAALLERGSVGPMKETNMIRGDDGQVYEMTEQACAACESDGINIERWDPRAFRWDTVATATGGDVELGSPAVGVGAGPDGSTYIAYLDVGDSECLTLVGGVKSCDLTVAPQIGPTTLYVDHFSPAGALEGTADVPLPFGAWGTPGEQIAEFVDPGTGVENITTLLDGTPRLTYVGGYQYANESETPNSPYTLAVGVTGLVFQAPEL